LAACCKRLLTNHWISGLNFPQTGPAENTDFDVTSALCSDCAIVKDIYQMDDNGFRNYFLRGMFRGEVFISPKTLASPTIVKKFVFNAPGGIGYIRANEVDASVKVLRIDGHLPENKDYVLQIDAAR
jgi:hypothetical protein